MIPCPSCHRHVRSTESTCPFCATALATVSASAAQASTQPTASRLDKIALELGLAALTIGAVSLVGCTDPEPGPDEMTTQDDFEAAAADYGGPEDDTGSPDTGDGDGDGDPGDGDPGDGDPGDGDPGDGDPETETGA